MSRRLRALAAPIARLMFARYLLASIVALAGDFAVFLMLDRAGAAPTVAAVGGYVFGLVIHWMISTRFVFDMRGCATHGQLLGFVLSALIGLAITTALVGLLSSLGLATALAKLLAIPVSFLSIYGTRKYGVFVRA